MHCISFSLNTPLLLLFLIVPPLLFLPSCLSLFRPQVTKEQLKPRQTQSISIFIRPVPPELIFPLFIPLHVWLVLSVRFLLFNFWVSSAVVCEFVVSITAFCITFFFILSLSLSPLSTCLFPFISVMLLLLLFSLLIFPSSVFSRIFPQKKKRIQAVTVLVVWAPQSQLPVISLLPCSPTSSWNVPKKDAKEGEEESLRERESTEKWIWDRGPERKNRMLAYLVRSGKKGTNVLHEIFYLFFWQLGEIAWLLHFNIGRFMVPFLLLLFLQILRPRWLLVSPLIHSLHFPFLFSLFCHHVYNCKLPRFVFTHAYKRHNQHLSMHLSPHIFFTFFSFFFFWVNSDANVIWWSLFFCRLWGFFMRRLCTELSQNTRRM